MRSNKAPRMALFALLFVANLAFAESFVFTNVNVVDVESGIVRNAQTIVVDEGRIVAVASAAPESIPAAARTVDGEGRWAIPGLWDMHVHLAMATEAALPVLIANGVTHVRDMGGWNLDAILAWREQIAKGERVGPTIATSGPILESARWIERAKGFLSEEEMRGRIAVGSAGEAATVIAELKARRVDFVKIRTVVSKEVYLAIAAEASKHGLAVVGHPPSPMLSLVEAAEAGHKSFEHPVVGPVIGMRLADMTAAVDVFKRRGTHFVPTLISGVGFRLTPDERVDAIIADDGTLEPRRAYVAKALAENWQSQMELKKTERNALDWGRIQAESIEFFKEIHAAGVPLMIGSDLGGPLVYPGFSIHEELALMVEQVGLTPTQALAAATNVPAAFMADRDDYGSVDAGRVADFVLLDANPLDDVRNTTAISGVMLQSRWFDRAELDSLLQRAREFITSH